MSETRMDYLQGERESKIRTHLRGLQIWEITEIISENIKLKDLDEYKEMLIEFIIEKNYIELEK